MELAALVVPEQADNLARAIEAAGARAVAAVELRVQGQKAAFDAEITLAPVFELPDRVAGIVAICTTSRPTNGSKIICARPSPGGRA